MIRVLVKAMGVLDYLGKQAENAAVLGDIAAATRLNAATCSRILTTLMETGYVEQEGRRKGYRLGPMAYVLTSKGPYRCGLVTLVEPIVHELSQATGETALVSVLRQNTRYTICKVDGQHEVQVRTDAVIREDLYPTATGRLLLAHMDDEALDACIRERGLPSRDDWPGITSRAALHAACADLRQQPLIEVIRTGRLAALATPLLERGRVTAALGLYLPESRYAGKHKQLVLSEIKKATTLINEKLNED